MYYDLKQIVTSKQVKEYEQLLATAKISYEPCQYQVGVYDNDLLIGAMSLHYNLIKLVCVDSNYNGSGIINTLYTDVLKYAYKQGVDHLFIYTTPNNKTVFCSLGFYVIYQTEQVLFLENNKDGISKYVKHLETFLVDKPNIGTLVINANPFSLGHLSLIEEACANCSHVHLFVVKADASVFPYELRYDFVINSVCHLKNLTVHEGSDYIISLATFPTYFIKSKGEILDIYANLDLHIFGKYIAKALKITKRYVGTEPFSKTTKMYNEVMKQVLPSYGVEVMEIERLTFANQAISASKIRSLIKANQLEALVNYVPQYVYDYLMSKQAADLLLKIQNSNSRH